MRKHLNVALALLAGLLGGLISRYIAPPAVMAQNQTPVTNEVRAQSFVLVNSAGKTMATLAPDAYWQKVVTLNPNAPSVGRIVLLDAGGHEIWSAGGSPFRTPSDRQ
jgi:hypothetical protein